MKIFEKIRNQSESRKKIILWATIIIIGLTSLLFYFRGLRENIINFKDIDIGETIKIPDFGEELNGWSDLNIPELNEEDLKRLEEEIKKINEEKQSTTTE